MYICNTNEKIKLFIIKIPMDNRLQRLFEQTKARKEKERQQKKQQRLQQYKELCKRADELLKQAQEQEKRKKMEYLSTLIPKHQEKPLIQVSRHITVYHSNLIQREPNKDDLYQTREELKEAEKSPNETGEINWSKWDEIVTKTKNKLYNDRTRSTKHNQKCKTN